MSANWSASTDSISGISGYQYAIGTTAGGTNVVGWTSVGNVLSVTRTGLSLNVGTTYYFSVKATDNAGLVGSATNSPGQTVQTGSTIYFQDNFESWSVYGGAWSTVNGVSSAHSLSTSTDFAAGGVTSIKIVDTDVVGGANGASLTKNFSPTISTDIHVRFFVYLPTGYTAANSGCSRRLLHIWCGSNRGQMSLVGAIPKMEEIGAWGAVEWPSALSENTWHCIEMHVAPPSTSTLLEFWVDGTKNSTSLTGNFSGSTAFTSIDLGDCALGAGTNGNGFFYLDELVVSQSYVGTTIQTPAPYFSDGFENWTVYGGAWSSVTGTSATLNTTTAYAEAGTQCLQVTLPSPAGYLTYNINPLATGDVYARCYFNFGSQNWSGNNPGSVRVLYLNYGSYNAQICLQGGNVASNIYLQESKGWTTVSGNQKFAANTWYCVQIHVAPPLNQHALGTVGERHQDGLNDGRLLLRHGMQKRPDRRPVGGEYRSFVLYGPTDRQ